MSDVIFKTRVDDFLARRVKDIIRQGSFRDEDAFFREAIKEMVRTHELRELDKRMDAFARKAAADQLMNFVRTCMLDIDYILKPLKKDLKEALGEKLSEVILFGSYSRGDYSQYSDIDLLILVETDPGKEETQMVDDLVASYSLKYDMVISGIVYPAEIYRRFNTPFLQNVKEEGIAI